ncbi:MAG TPA: hypothetical protein VFR36_07030 [Sphingomicrobium sp.]|nr:hypothetical protein [Sphingomicrobium sp.]
MSKRVFFAGLVALLGCGVASAATNPSDGASPNSSFSPSKEWMHLQAAYAGQQEGLQLDLGNSVFVASYQGVVHDGQLATFSIWTDSVPTALPKTDFVWLQDAKMTRWFVVPWSDLEAAIGKLSALERVEPPRYLTPANIPPSYFSSLEKTFVPPRGFPERLATGSR